MYTTELLFLLTIRLILRVIDKTTRAIASPCSLNTDSLRITLNHTAASRTMADPTSMGNLKTISMGIKVRAKLQARGLTTTLDMMRGIGWRGCKASLQLMGWGTRKRRQ